MKKQFNIVFCCIALLAVTSCTELAKQRPINRIESLCETLERDWDDLTDADFEEIAEEYEEATEEIIEYSDSYTQEEKREILRLHGRFDGIMARKTEQLIQGVVDEIYSWTDVFDSYSEGFDEGYGEY